MQILFISPGNGSGFSGKEAAALLLIDGLIERGWHCELLRLPALERDESSRLRGGLKLAAALLEVSAQFVRASVRPRALYLSLSQSLVGMLRDGVPFLILRWLHRSQPAAIALHGSIFMGWGRGSVCGKLFRFICNQADVITVLGPTQAKHLEALGVSSEKIKVVPNAVDLEPISEETVREKQASRPLRCLFLSNLIPSKGYPIFLEAFELLAMDPATQPMEAVLCGPIKCTPFDEEPFASRAPEWIRQKIELINRSGRIRVRHINGARGEEKERLFREAHVFVFPSTYPVEAQPLVLIEAFASGCAVVTSEVGEIPFTVGSAAVTIKNPTPESVAEEILGLASQADEREALALAALDRFREVFSLKVHLDTWEEILLPRNS